MNILTIIKSNVRKQFKTLFFATSSIMMIVMAMILVNFSTSDGSSSREKLRQIVVNKTPVTHEIPDNINRIKIISNHNSRGPKITIDFQESAVIKVAQHLDYKLIDDYKDINLNKIAWKIDGNTITMNIHDSFDTRTYYQSQGLKITLPHKDWDITLPTRYHRNDINNKNAAINLTLLTDVATVSGNFKKLSIWRREKYAYDTRFKFDDADIEKLYIYVGGSEIITPLQVQLGKSLRMELGKSLRAGAINVYAPSYFPVNIDYLSHTNKVNFLELSKKDKPR